MQSGPESGGSQPWQRCWSPGPRAAWLRSRWEQILYFCESEYSYGLCWDDMDCLTSDWCRISVNTCFYNTESFQPVFYLPMSLEQWWSMKYVPTILSSFHNLTEVCLTQRSVFLASEKAAVLWQGMLVT